MKKILTNWRNHSVIYSLCKSRSCREFLTSKICFNAFRENKILAKISEFAISKLVYSFLLCYRCFVTISDLWLFLKVPWVGLQCVIVVFPDHIHLLFNNKGWYL